MPLHPSEAWLAEHRALIRQAFAGGSLSMLELLCRKAFTDGVLRGISDMSAAWDQSNAKVGAALDEMVKQ